MAHLLTLLLGNPTGRCGVFLEAFLLSGFLFVPALFIVALLTVEQSSTGCVCIKYIKVKLGNELSCTGGN